MLTIDNSSNVPAFLIKLWKLVEDSSCDELIAWSETGISFIIKDQVRFARELLPQYFKHNNMASFVRQLNMYGFRKVMNYEKSGLNNDNNEMEFQHAFFLKEQCELLELIKRKIPNTRMIAEPSVKSNAKDILLDLTSIRDKQESMNSMLLKMKQENELLWKELTNMRQKHKQQEQVIDKVIHFLVQVLRNQPLGVGIQRKIPRMIHDSPGSKSGASQITTVDLLRKNPKCIIVQDKKSTGPFIHEITEFDVEDLQSVSSVNLPSQIVTSPASKQYDKSPSPSISLCSPSEKSPAMDSNPGKEMIHCPLDSSSLNSPIDSNLALDSLNILEPLQSRTPALGDDVSEDEAVLGIPLDYITANDVGRALNGASTYNVMSIPEDSNVISIPEGTDIGNVISIPEGTDISNVISIPEGTDISEVISIPEGTDVSDIISISNDSNTNKASKFSKNQHKVITVPNSSVKNVSSIPDATVTNLLSSNKTLSPISIPNFYDAEASLDDLEASSSSNGKNTLDGSISKHEYVDPLMCDTLNTPLISLTDDIGLSDFTFHDKKNISEREHDYPASVSDSSSTVKPSVGKNTLSNHLLTVEEQLNRLQDHIATNTWDVDADKLLGVCPPWAISLYPQLFSSDGMETNDSLVDHLTGGLSIKKEPEDILGSKFDQLTPQMLEAEFDELRSPFLDQLVCSDRIEDELSREKVGLLDNVLVDAKHQDATLEISDNLNNDICTNSASVKRHKQLKTPKSKRRKLK